MPDGRRSAAAFLAVPGLDAFPGRDGGDAQADDGVEPPAAGPGGGDGQYQQTAERRAQRGVAVSFWLIAPYITAPPAWWPVTRSAAACAAMQGAISQNETATPRCARRSAV